MENLNGAPECLPLKTFSDVVQWSPRSSSLNFASASVPLKLNVQWPGNRPRTLVCHDMRGGYLQDRFTQGAEDGSAYRCFNWQHIDTFIYFSHYFVTIPPPVWTNTCHKHDVFCLGTLITEWDDGKANCVEMLKSEEAYKSFADKLVLIAESYGFDGWLINIENPIEKSTIKDLVGFLTYLTSQMHKAIAHSQVIWYDSVIETGELVWQDELNDKNEIFFGCTDAIFLNYGWKDETLSQSEARAKSHGRPWDVYVGVDVFGRGCYGGGGFNTCQAMEKIREYNLSAAIFAPGWVYEKMENFTQEEYKFWSLIVPYLYTKPICSLPFCTNFCQGQGGQYFQAGKSVCEKPWTNLSRQGVQPLLSDKPSNISVDFTDAWSGGACLKLTSGGSELPSKYKFFEFDVQLPSTTVISYAFKIPSHVHFALVLTIENKDEKQVRYVLGDEEAICTGDESDSKLEIVPSLASNDLVPEVCQNLQNPNNGWCVRTFIIKEADGLRLKGVTSHILMDTNNPQTESPNLEGCFVKLGHLQISGTEISKAAKLSELEVTSNLLEQHDDLPNLVDVSCELTWSYENKSKIPQSNVTSTDSETPQAFHVYYYSIGNKQHSTGSDSREHNNIHFSREHKLVAAPQEDSKYGTGDKGATRPRENNQDKVVEHQIFGSTEEPKLGSGVKKPKIDPTNQNAPSPAELDYVFLGSVMTKSSKLASDLAQPVVKYRVCDLLVDTNVTSSLRFTIQPVDILGKPQEFSQCMFVDFPISLQ